MNRYFEALTHSFDIMVDGMDQKEFYNLDVSATSFDFNLVSTERSTVRLHLTKSCTKISAINTIITGWQTDPE